MKLYLLLLVVAVLSALGNAQNVRGANRPEERSSTIREKMGTLAERLGLASKEREDKAEYDQAQQLEQQQQMLYERNQAAQVNSPRMVSRPQGVNIEAYRDSVAEKVEEMSNEDLLKFSDVFKMPMQQQPPQTQRPPPQMQQAPQMQPPQYGGRPRPMGMPGGQYEQQQQQQQQQQQPQQPQQPNPQESRLPNEVDIPIEQAPIERAPSLEELSKFGDKFADITAKMRPAPKSAKGGKETETEAEELEAGEEHERRLQALVAGVDPYYGADIYGCV